MLNQTDRQELRRIEAVTGRIVSIELQAKDYILSKCHLQEQSPLFKLPGELRNLIFEFAATPFNNLVQPPVVAEHYYRLENHARHVTSTNLPLTCRRAWLEANHLAMEQAQHCFWFKRKNGRLSFLDHTCVDEANRLNRASKPMAYDTEYTNPGTLPVGFISSLTINNRRNLKKIQLFAQTYWLEAHLPNKLQVLLGGSGVCPETLTITITHADWGSRGRGIDAPLVPIDERQWLKKLLEFPALPRLNRINLEMETLESRIDELRLIEGNLRQRFDLVERTDHFGDPRRVALQVSPPERTWSGPTNLLSERHDSYNNTDKLNYRILTLTWRVEPFPSENAALRRESCTETNTLNLTHIPGPKLPAFSIASPGRAPLELLRTFDGPEGREAEYLMQRWKDEGSLLKFAPTNIVEW